MIPTKPIRVLSERIMSRGFEPTVGRLMENVQKVVRRQPGLLSVETLSDMNDHHKYVVLSEWRSKQDYDAWLNSKEFKECTAKIEEVLDVPGKRTTIFKRPNEDIFLLQKDANDCRGFELGAADADGVAESAQPLLQTKMLSVHHDGWSLPEVVSQSLEDWKQHHSSLAVDIQHHCKNKHIKQNMVAGRIKVISERIMSRGYEPAVASLMETVKAKVRAQPGLVSVTTYNQLDQSNKYVVFSEWRSKKDYDQWVSSKEFQECTAKINELLDVPGLHTRVFTTPKEDIFLL